MKLRAQKPRVCQRCDASIQPALQSHAAISLVLRDCDGLGEWVETKHRVLHLCAPCWKLVDDLVADGSREQGVRAAQHVLGKQARRVLGAGAVVRRRLAVGGSDRSGGNPSQDEPQDQEQS